MFSLQGAQKLNKGISYPSYFNTQPSNYEMLGVNLIGIEETKKALCEALDPKKDEQIVQQKEVGVGSKRSNEQVIKENQ